MTKGWGKCGSGGDTTQLIEPVVQTAGWITLAENQHHRGSKYLCPSPQGDGETDGNQQQPEQSEGFYRSSARRILCSNLRSASDRLTVIRR